MTTQPQSKKPQPSYKVYAQRKAFNTVAISARPSSQQVAERDRALAARRSLTAALLGDPAPGRSALDRRAKSQVRP
jgi:hypothetical protein